MRANHNVTRNEAIVKQTAGDMTFTTMSGMTSYTSANLNDRHDLKGEVGGFCRQRVVEAEPFLFSDDLRAATLAASVKDA